MGRGTVMYRSLASVALHVRFMELRKCSHQIPSCQRSWLAARDVLMGGALDDSLAANFRLSRNRLQLSNALPQAGGAREGRVNVRYSVSAQ